MNKILNKKILAKGSVIEFEISHPQIAKKVQPGQFIILKSGETGERVPLTIADSDAEKGTFIIIFQIIGKTTDFFSKKEIGDSFSDITGPLGKPTHMEKIGKVVAVGGGIGIAPLNPIIKGFKKAGNHIISIMGSRNKELLILEENIKKISDELHICTDDGSYCRAGFVTDILAEILEKDKSVKKVIAAGPVPMMKAVCNLTKKYNVSTIVSLNPIMVDGTGMCGACRCSVGNETKFACVDGPEFDGHLVDFDELAMRLSAYHEYEATSWDLFKKNK